MENDIEIKWENNTSRSRELIQKTKGSQMIVAALALEVCEIRRGGRVRDSFYTLKRFAKEVGVPYRTLHHWVVVRKSVYNEIDESFRDKLGYTDMLHISKLIGKDCNKRKLRKVVSAYITGNRFEARVIKYLNSLKALAYNLRDPSIVNNISHDSLRQVVFFSKIIVERIKKNYEKPLRNLSLKRLDTEKRKGRTNITIEMESIIKKMRNRKKSFQQICDHLVENGFKTSKSAIVKYYNNHLVKKQPVVVS